MDSKYIYIYILETSFLFSIPLIIHLPITERQSWRIESKSCEPLHSKLYFEIYLVIITYIYIIYFLFFSLLKFQYVLSLLFILFCPLLRYVTFWKFILHFLFLCSTLALSSYYFNTIIMNLPRQFGVCVWMWRVSKTPPNVIISSGDAESSWGTYQNLVFWICPLDPDRNGIKSHRVNRPFLKAQL